MMIHFGSKDFLIVFTNVVYLFVFSTGNVGRSGKV